MPLVTSLQMLNDAQQNGYAVGAFNAENMEMMQAIISVAGILKAPVIIQTTPSTVRYASLSLFHSMAAALANESSVPVALHLDHGSDANLAIQAIHAGYTSVMIDGSHEPFEQNIAVTKQVVAAATLQGVPVEAELGTVGGKEDDLDNGAGGCTDPAEAKAFAERTGISSFAVAIGTAHGIYSGTPKLDIQRLIAIRKVVSIPLVLHGASGLSADQLKECIANGISKINFATELRLAYSNGVKELLGVKPDTYDPKAYGKAGRDRVKQTVADMIRICGCDGRY